MFYMGCDTDNAQLWLDNPEEYTLGSIGLATSPDGIEWTREPGPILSPQEMPAWDCFALEGPAVLYDNGVWRLWYGGYGTEDWETEVTGIGYAEKEGDTWVRKYAQPLIRNTGKEGDWNAFHLIDPNVVKDGDIYFLFTSGAKELGNTDIAVMQYSYLSAGVYTSVDGINWTQMEGNPILSCGRGGWDDFASFTPCAVIRDDTWFIYYTGITKGDMSSYRSYGKWAIGLCRASR
jgi:predicted GH43/DUF377 family glycosyl hydrolase